MIHRVITTPSAVDQKVKKLEYSTNNETFKNFPNDNLINFHRSCTLLQ